MNLDIWFGLVESDSDMLELHGQFLLLCLSFLAIKHHQDQIGRLADTDNLSSSTRTNRGTLDNTWQIQELHLGIVDIKNTWNTS
jgi:hypothetical protein